MIIRLPLIIFCLITVSICHGQNLKSPEDNRFQKIIDTTITKARELSLYSDSVNWYEIEKAMSKIASEAKQSSDLKPAFELMLNELGDYHGAIRRASDYSNFARMTDVKNSRKKDNRNYDQKTGRIVNNPDARFSYKILPNNIGYLNVVGVGPNVDGQSEANRIRKALIEFHGENVDKWIIDLRYNGGGNVNVMLSGLAPLLNTEKVLTIRDLNNKVLAYAEIKNGNFAYYGYQAFEMDDEPDIKNPKVAILMSRWTVSSGEFVAVAFKGQDNTRFFGEETGGYTTNTSWDSIAEEFILSITTGIYSDRDGNLYPDNVPPDEKITFVVENDTKKDTMIHAAREWLMDE
ncbi:MAG: S41 family peptidase [Bacteroidota bacterium]